MQAFISLIKNPIKYNLFLLQKLPLGFFTGLKIVSINNEHCAVSVKYKWLNKNPFKSIYFAVLSMAAELSTGVLAFGNIYGNKEKVSMLVTAVNAEFYKKAVGKIIFTCANGNDVKRSIDKAINSKESETIICTSIGKNEAGEVVAKFEFTWSFKVK